MYLTYFSVFSMIFLLLSLLSIVSFFLSVHSFNTIHFNRIFLRNSLKMANVEIIFPNGKKAVAASGSALKDAAKKAGFSPNYGCEEGMILAYMPHLQCPQIL